MPVLVTPVKNRPSKRGSRAATARYQVSNSSVIPRFKPRAATDAGGNRTWRSAPAPQRHKSTFRVVGTTPKRIPGRWWRGWVGRPSMILGPQRLLGCVLLDCVLSRTRAGPPPSGGMGQGATREAGAGGPARHGRRPRRNLVPTAGGRQGRQHRGEGGDLLRRGIAAH